MYTIGIVGDLHIDTTISSRKDDYFSTCLQKIEEVASNCTIVIFLGDIFNRSVIPNEYFYRLYTYLVHLNKTYDCDFYSIIGNHDIPNEDESNLLKTSLGLCDLTGVIKLITVDRPLKFGKYTFHTSYVNLNKCKDHLKTLKLGENDILLLHQYFEDEHEGLSISDISDIGCNKVFLGHEHTPFYNYVKDFGQLKVYRCGSLLRNAANSSNLSRDIYYFKLYENNISIEQLKCAKPAIEVFTESAYNQENLHKKHFIKNINDVLEKYTNNIATQTKFSIKQTLVDLHTPENSLNYISKVYANIGEIFS